MLITLHYQAVCPVLLSSIYLHLCPVLFSSCFFVCSLSLFPYEEMLITLCYQAASLPSPFVEYLPSLSPVLFSSCFFVCNPSLFSKLLVSHLIESIYQPSADPYCHFSLYSSIPFPYILHFCNSLLSPLHQSIYPFSLSIFQYLSFSHCLSDQVML